jgi:hypothetical protein
MRLLPRSRSTSAVVASGATALAVLLVGATAAVADPADPADPVNPAEQQAAEPGTSLATSPHTPGCTDALVTFSRDGVVGDDRAVAVTAQSLQRDVDGWQLLAWQADAGTTLTLVLASGADGDLRALPPRTSGVVENVLSLTFCGRYEGAQEVTAEPPSAETAQPVSDVTEAGERSASSPPEEAHHPTSDAADEAVADEAGPDERQRGTAEADVEVDAPPANTGPRQPVSEPAGPAVEHLGVAGPEPTPEGRTVPAPAPVPAPASLPITLAVGAGPSEVLDAEPVVDPESGGGRLLMVLLAAAGGAATLAAVRRSATRGRSVPAVPPGHTPHEHMGATR